MGLVFKGIQTVGVAVGIFLIVQALYRFRRGDYGWRKTIFFFGLWSLVTVLFVQPSLA